MLSMLRVDKKCFTWMKTKINSFVFLSKDKYCTKYGFIFVRHILNISISDNI